MNDEPALLAAIRAHPDEDTPRLVYADFLQERGGPGDSVRAEFIRVQVELARMDADTVENCVPRWGELSVRERELLAFATADWIGGLPGCIASATLSVGDPPVWHYWTDDKWLSDEGKNFIRPYFHRGFPGRVDCTGEDWQAHGDAIRERHPITHVRLTTHVLSSARTDYEPMPITWYLKRWPGVTFELPE